MKLPKMTEKKYRILSIALLICTFIMLLVLNFAKERIEPYGEWDDFILVTVSFLNDGDVTIDASDIVKARELLPEWTKDLDNYKLSPYTIASGEELSWYFPTFGIMCVPIMFLLNLFGISGIYTVPIVNICLYMTALVYLFLKGNFSERIKFWCLLAFAANPIILYTRWVSGEVYIFAFLLLTLVCWDKKQYKRTGIFISLASHLNPAVLMVGIVVIAEYLVNLLKETGIRKILGRWKEIAVLAVCFLPSLFPFAWNLYHMGSINMTAATETDFALANWIGRFFAYLIDLNLGYLPYFGILFVLFVAAFFLAVWKKQWRTVIMGVAFWGTCLIYSLEIHINSGMSGLARYSAWAGAIMIMTFFVWRRQIKSEKLERGLDVGVGISALWTIVMMTTILMSNFIGYMEMTPLARGVLRYAPQLYNPFPDVFDDRVCHVDDFGYQHNMPVVYRDGYWECRKMLVNYDDKEYIMSHIDTSEENAEWLEQKLDALEGKGDCYISIGRDKVIYWKE